MNRPDLVRLNRPEVVNFTGACTFGAWSINNGPSWYKAYNETKHDRDLNFHEANFENLVNAFAGLFALLSAQFGSQDYMPGSTSLALNVDSFHSGDFGLGGYLKIVTPKNWDLSEKYDFDWSKLKSESDRFLKFNYDAI